jgi:hypothetical protein
MISFSAHGDRIRHLPIFAASAYISGMTQEPPCRKVSGNIRSEVAERGWAVLPGVLGAEEVAGCCRELTRLTMLAGDDGSLPLPGASVMWEPGFAPCGRDQAARELGIRKYFQFAQADPFFWGLLRDRRLTDPVEAVLGAGVQVLQTMALVKPPEIGSAKDWHQDTPYFAIAPVAACVGIWLALDAATTENGCMQFVPGSHRDGPRPHVQGPTGWRLAEADARVAQAAAVPVPVPAGTAIIFDANTLHFTDINRSQRRRRAIQYHYVSASTRACGGDLRLHPLTDAQPPRSGSPS